VLGFGDALLGIVRHPYLGAKQEGSLGFGKGVGRGLAGLCFHSMAGELHWRMLEIMHG
jgi:sterol 3beta-glucosyltransferase